jgi:phage tail P2-like protein
MWRTIDIVPSSIRDDPQVMAACDSIDAELEAIYGGFLQGSPDADPSICFWPDIMTQVPPLLDVLAWEMHVDVWAGWEGDLDIETKRSIIAQSIYWHQHKGTRYAVDSMLATVFKEGVVTEWYEYGGNPYYFRIIVQEEIQEPEKLGRVIDAVYAVKNVRSWLDSPGVIQSRPYQQTLYHTIVIREKMTTRIGMKK